MKKLIFFFLLTSCSIHVEDLFIVDSVKSNPDNIHKQKYRVGFKTADRCFNGDLYLFTDRLFQVGDTIKFEK